MIRIAIACLALLFALPAMAADGKSYNETGPGSVKRSGWYLCDAAVGTKTCTPRDGAGNQIMFAAGSRFTISTSCNGGGSITAHINHTPLTTLLGSTLVTLDTAGNTAAVIVGAPAGYITANVVTNTCTSLDIILEVY